MAAVGLRRRKIELLLEDLDQIPTLPGLAHHVLGVATSEQPTRRDLQMAAEVDPAIAAKILRLAIDLGHPADDLLSIDAVFDAVGTDVLSAALLNTQAVDRDLLETVQLPRLWRHALAVALAAQVTATRLGTVSPEQALLAGLLHDIGQLALRILMPRAYAQVLDQLDASGEDLLEAERDLLGIDHAVFGKRLAQQWGFSETFQNVIWLHHQAQVPEGGRPGAASLIQVIRLADLLARQHGFGYYGSEQVKANPAEVAERLGLSGVQADHIARQIDPALALNTEPVGFDALPSDAQLQEVYRQANVRLGRLQRQRQKQAWAAEAKADHARRLIDLNADLATLTSPREVMQRVADAAHGALGCRVVVPFLLARDGGYVEGLRHTADRGVEDHFLYDRRAGDDLAPPQESPPAAGPVRAERAEPWLFDRQGPDLGPGPFYTVPMCAGERRIGGVTFSWTGRPEEPAPHEADQMADLARIAAVALRRAQAEADLVALSEELADTNRRLQATHRATLQQENVASLSEMAIGAAHAINNPLAIISGRIQQLAADEQDPDRRQTLETVIQQAHRISEIIAELRTFAKPPAPAPAPVNPRDLAREVAGDQRPDEDEAGVRLQVEGPQEAPAIHVDRGQVGGAVAEVVRNAVQACTEAGGGTVTLRVEFLPAQAAVRFVVLDDGPGMAPERQARAFDPFFSGHEAGRRRGLGLSKAYQAVRMNGGQMALESAPGRGTTVRVTFPAGEGRQTAPQQDPTDAATHKEPE